jgi:excinuclease UvrABC nuclease subunit
MTILKINFEPIYVIWRTYNSRWRGSYGPGVYVFKNGSKILYVGSSEEINRRLRQHIEFNNETFCPLGGGEIFTDIDQYSTENSFEAIMLEYWLQKHLKPNFNKEKNRQGFDIRSLCNNTLNKSLIEIKVIHDLYYDQLNKT